MSNEIRTKRRYTLARRRVQAEETKRAIIEAAHILFIGRGYAGTTMDAIALQAGVAVETVYTLRPCAPRERPASAGSFPG